MPSNDSSRYCAGCLMPLEKSYQVCPNCGTNNASFDNEPPKLKVRTILNGKYLVGRALGQGGFGITYLGLDMVLGLRVAIKEFYPDGNVYRQMTGHPTVMPYTQDASLSFMHGRDRFLEEARLLARVSSERSVVKVRDFFQENNTVYIVMEYVEGRTLAQLIKDKGGKMSADEALTLLHPIIHSLDHLHAMGVLHRDISPDNIMLRPDGSLVLLDFGAAHIFSAMQPKTMTVSLKRGYAPIEQYDEHGSQGPWTDVYALCATIYHMIVGKPPVSSVDRLVDKASLVLPPEARDTLTHAQEEALLHGLALYSKDRTPSMCELEAQLYNLPLNSEARTAGGTPKKKTNRALWITLGVVAAAAAAALVLPGMPRGTTPTVAALPTSTEAVMETPTPAAGVATESPTSPDVTAAPTLTNAPATPEPTATPVPTPIPQSLSGVSLADSHVDEATRLQYSLHNNQAIITGYLGNANELEIPPIIDRYIVSVIHASFSSGTPGAAKLTSIVLPSTLVSLEDGALNGCTALTALTGGENLVYVTKYGFDQTPWFKALCEANPQYSVTAFNGVLLDEYSTSEYQYYGDWIRLITATAFENATNKTEIRLKGTMIVAENALNACQQLTYLSIDADGVTFMGPIGTSFEHQVYLDVHPNVTADFSNLLLALSKTNEAALSCHASLTRAKTESGVVLQAPKVPDNIYFIPFNESANGLWTYRIVDCTKLEDTREEDTPADRIRYVDIARYNGTGQEIVFVPEKIGGCYVTHIRSLLVSAHPEVKVLILPQKVRCLDATDEEYDPTFLLGMEQLEYIAVNGTLGDGIWLAPEIFPTTPWCQRKLREAQANGQDCMVLFDKLLLKCIKDTQAIVIPKAVSSWTDNWCADTQNVTDVTLSEYEWAPCMVRSGIQHLITLRLAASSTGFHNDSFTNFTELEQVVGVTPYCYVRDVSARAFSGCSALKSFPSVSMCYYFGEEAFLNCASLSDIPDIGNQPDSCVIEARAFKGCTSLPELKITTSGDTSIAEEAFCDCTSLALVQLSDTVTVAARAFAGCTSLRTVRIVASDRIDADAFAGCTAITDVVLYEGSDLSLLETLFQNAAGPITVSCLAKDAHGVKLPEKFTLVLRDQ